MGKATKHGGKKSNAKPESKRIEEAAFKWVLRFNCIPQNVIAKLRESGDGIVEIGIPNGSTKYETALPMWDTMWSFNDAPDYWWLLDKKNLKAMAACGFRIYKQEDFGYIFGIDGAGYDFFESHWIPLYKARGLQWHVVD